MLHANECLALILYYELVSFYLRLQPCERSDADICPALLYGWIISITLQLVKISGHVMLVV